MESIVDEVQRDWKSASVRLSSAVEDLMASDDDDGDDAMEESWNASAKSGARHGHGLRADDHKTNTATSQLHRATVEEQLADEDNNNVEYMSKRLGMPMSLGMHPSSAHPLFGSSSGSSALHHNERMDLSSDALSSHAGPSLAHPSLALLVARRIREQAPQKNNAGASPDPLFAATPQQPHGHGNVRH